MIDAGGRTRLEAGGRFRLDVPSLHHRGTWSWEKSPFVGSRPYEGLLVILMLFNSWDLKDSNNALYDVKHDQTAAHWYVVRDLGGALGESGHLRPKRNNVEKFERHTFITGVAHGFVKFDYHGKQPSLIRDRIRVDDVRWAMDRLKSLSDQEWHDAFRAGGFPRETSDRFIRKVQADIAAGMQLPDGDRRSTDGRR
jgi:hypothetical protein